jgi:hypothetical protein
MERLKTRQRLEKLNTLGSPAPLANPEINYDAPEDDNSSHLASKIRVNSIINQSIPDMSYPPKKFKTQVTAKEIEEYQQKENTPIQIDGQFYRIHPASIPEPELEEVAPDSLVQSMYDKRSEKGVEINDLLVSIKITRQRLVNVDKELVELDEQYNAIMNAPAPKRTSQNRVNILNTPLTVNQLMGLETEQFELQRANVEKEYFDRKAELLQERDAIIGMLDALQAQLDETRIDIDEFDLNFYEQVEAQNAKKARNKARVKEFEDNLKSVNRTFNITQDPNETDEEYIIRLRDQTSAIEDPRLISDRYDLDQAREFKRNMKEIIRDNSTIEVAFNTLTQENGGANRNIPDINKVFQLIKTRYEKLYGTFQLNDVDLIRFLKQIIEDPELTARRAQEEEDALIALASGDGGASAGSERLVPLPSGLTDAINEKYKVVSKASNYTNAELVREIKDLKDFFTQPIEAVDKDGNNVKLSKGDGGGLNVEYKGVVKNVSVTPKSALVAVFVGLLEHIKATNADEYATLNQKVNTKTNQTYGEGMGIPHEPLPKSCKLGKIEIDLNKLFYKNILSVKHNGFKINGVKNAPVGDEFVKIIMELCKGNYPTTKELNKLGAGESQIYDSLLHIAGLHKRVEHTANKSVDALKNRLTLIEGEITAGNTNKQLYQELRDIVFKLHHLGEITQNSATEYLKQMK